MKMYNRIFKAWFFLEGWYWNPRNERNSWRIW